MPITDLPASVTMNVYGQNAELPVFPSDEETGDYVGVFATPAENIVQEGWTQGDGYGHYCEVGAVKSIKAPNSTGIRAFATPHPSFNYDGYATAYEGEVGEKYTGGPSIVISIWAVVAILAVIVFAIVLIYAVNQWRAVQFYALEKSTEFTQTPVANDTSNCWSVVCKGNTCQYFNTCTGETKTGPEGEKIWGATSQFGDVVKWAGYVVVGALALYATIKLYQSYQRGRPQQQSQRKEEG